MAQSLAMRATSLAASAALLALASIAALTLSWSVARLAPTHEGPIIVSEHEPLATPPQTRAIPHVRPPDATQSAPDTTDPVTSVPISNNPSDRAEPIPDIAPPTISNPHWLQTPRDLSHYYPMMALRRDMEGDVALDCLVATSGQLHCAIVSETPANWGFGAAAIRIAQDYRMAPATREGAPVEGRYRMRVPFRLNR